MKLLILSILFLCISTLFGQTTFNRLEDYFGTNGRSSNFIQATLLYNNKYYHSLGIYDTLQVFYYCMIKTDKQGNEIDRFVFKNPNGLISEYPNQTLIPTSDSNIMICANLVDSTWSGYLIKLDTNLDTLWTRVYDMPVNLCGCSSNTRSINYFTAIKETPDKGFIIAGNYYKNCVNYSQYLRGFLLKVDSAGDVMWWKAYNNIVDLYDIELSVNGGYLVYNKWGGKSIVEFDSLGNEIWRKQPNYVPSIANYGDITYCGNGIYAAASVYLWDIPNNNSEVHVFKFSVYTHQILWDTIYKLFYSVNSLSINQVMGLEVDHQGNLVIWATAHVNPAPYVGGKRGAVLKLNSQGDSLWERYYDSPGITWDDDLQLNDLIICDDGGYMGVGYQRFGHSGKVMAWLFKTDSNGVVGWESQKAKDESKKAKVWPNPATEFVHIAFADKPKQDAELMVYNSLGQLVLEENIGKGKQAFRLDVRRFPSGLYFFEAVSNKQVLGRGKFVVE